MIHRRHLLALALLAAPALAVQAGEYFETDGLALRGHDPVAYFKENRPVLGRAEFTAQHQGSTFRFASPAHRAAFVADPAKYAPQYGGFCAFGTAGGYKATIDPAAFTIADGKLYLNYNREVQKQWSADQPGFIAKADRNWPSVSKQTKVFE